MSTAAVERCMLKGKNYLAASGCMDKSPGETGHSIGIEGLVKRFNRIGGEQVNAIDNLSLHVEQGQFVVLVGPIGCGKTRLLRCLAWLVIPDDGRVEFTEMS